eukprot:503365-Alexandrium_andersonii.AAC.1
MGGASVERAPASRQMAPHPPAPRQGPHQRQARRAPCRGPPRAALPASPRPGARATGACSGN